MAPPMIVSTRFLLEYFLLIYVSFGRRRMKEGRANLEVITPHKPRIVRHRQLNIMQQDEIREIDLKPVIPWIAGLEECFQHLEDLLEFWLEQLVDDDQIEL